METDGTGTRIDRQRYEREFQFKQLCSRVAAITGPWNCVVYRDIRLLKAHSCRVASPAIAWAMQLLVLTNYVIPLREAICAMRMPSYSYYLCCYPNSVYTNFCQGLECT